MVEHFGLAGIYLYEGDRLNASISFIGILPWGQAATGARLAAKYTPEVLSKASRAMRPIPEYAIKALEHRGLRKKFDTELLEAVREYREKTTNLSKASFKKNVAAMSVRVNGGDIEYYVAENLQSSPLHSEGTPSGLS